MEAAPTGHNRSILHQTDKHLVSALEVFIGKSQLYSNIIQEELWYSGVVSGSYFQLCDIFVSRVAAKTMLMRKNIPMFDENRKTDVIVRLGGRGVWFMWNLSLKIALTQEFTEQQPHRTSSYLSTTWKHCFLFQLSKALLSRGNWSGLASRFQ